MASRKRALLEPTDDWQQLQFQLDWPEQTRYELIRPVVVFGAAPVDRSKQTGVSASTIYRKVSRFDEAGMQSLFEAEPVEDKRALPPAYREAIAQLKAEYPAFRPNELATICETRFERRPSRATIRKILSTEPAPEKVERRFPRYAEMADPLDRRGAIIRLHAEGWNIASIAGYLETSRPTVYATLKRWIEEGVRGLEDKPSIPHQPATKTTLWAMNEVRKLQQNPELGAFRIHAALKQLGIRLSTRTCGRILARNRKLYGLRGHEATPRDPKPMPFKAHWRHEYWTVDVRYIDVHRLGGGNIYTITILDNYSRFIVGSVLSRAQNLRAYLHVLLSAVKEYGAPQALVSDGGSIFKAKGAEAIYQALSIGKERIQLRQPWQSYIETCFNVQRRMADYHFSQATTWRELEERHAAWVHDYNSQEHWAHLKRQDGRRSPAEVLDQVKGRAFSDQELARIFAPLPPAPIDVPLIDRAEALLVELQAIVLRLDGRNRCNVGVNLEIIQAMAEASDELVPDMMAARPLQMGEGHRLCDEMDRYDAIYNEAEARIAALHLDIKPLARPLTPAMLRSAVDELLAERARIEADLVARFGEEGRRAFNLAEDIHNIRVDREWKERRRKERSAA